MRPLIGVTGSVDGAGVRVRRGYVEGVSRVGGVAVGVVPVRWEGGAVETDAEGWEAEAAGRVVAGLDGLVLTGGDDPVMEGFGVATDARVTRVHAARQRWELLLLREAEAAGLPVLGVCLGMQLMCLRAGGVLDQWLLDSLGEGAYGHVPRDGEGDVRHGVTVCVGGSVFGAAGDGWVNSWHRQGIVDGGELRVVARSRDGLVECVDEPGLGFWVGVQWHPERMDWGTSDGARFGRGVFAGLVEAARARRGAGVAGGA